MSIFGEAEAAAIGVKLSMEEGEPAAEVAAKFFHDSIPGGSFPKEDIEGYLNKFEVGGTSAATPNFGDRPIDGLNLLAIPHAYTEPSPEFAKSVYNALKNAGLLE